MGRPSHEFAILQLHHQFQWTKGNFFFPTHLAHHVNLLIHLNRLKIKHGNDYQTDYYPDLITNDSISFLRESKQRFDHQPFMMVMSFPSPHGPEDSAPQYSDMFFNVTRHRTPSYDFAPNPDKQWILRWLGKMKPVHHRFTDLLMTKRLQTLQSVDEAVEKIFSELVALGQLDNTYIFYTSDHGYHLGQFGLIKGKSHVKQKGRTILSWLLSINCQIAGRISVITSRPSLFLFLFLNENSKKRRFFDVLIV